MPGHEGVGYAVRSLFRFYLACKTCARKAFQASEPQDYSTEMQCFVVEPAVLYFIFS
jgi:hypothetical protein